MKLIEAVVNGLTTTLQNQIPAVLNQIEINEADDIHLDTPKLYLDWKPLTGEVAEFPCIAVVAGRSTPIADNGAWLDAFHNVAVIAFLEDADPRTLQVKLLRYQQAILVVLARNRTGVLDRDGLSAWSGINTTGTEPGSRFNIGSSGGSTFGDYTIVYARATRGDDL